MAISRNAPCPCGSGKKYKACCQQADQARARTSAILGVADEPAWHPAAREARVWEADVVPIPIGFADDPEAAPALAMVVAAGFVVVVETRSRRPVGAAERARVLGDALRQAGQVLGVLPERLHVRDADVAAILGRELRDRAVAVEAASLAEVDDALDAAISHVVGKPSAARIASPEAWAETEASEAELAAYHEAAAEYYAAAPWADLDDDALLRVELRDGSVWIASVMGAAGVEFGLALYTDLLDLLGLMDDEDSFEDRLLSMTGFAITTSFDPRSERPRRMQREVASRGWRIAAPSAYPMLLGLNLPERRVTAAHVRASAAALRAIARLASGCEPDPAEVESVTRIALDDDDSRVPWTLPVEAAPVCAEGPGARPEAALRAFEDGDAFGAAEEARLERMLAWLEPRASSKAARAADQRNARFWTDFLQFHGLAAGAVTEYDLRLFLFDFYIRKVEAPKTAARALPRSIRRILAFLEEEEGIHYPFLGRVLDDLDAVAQAAQDADEPFEVALDALERAVFEDLALRGMLHAGHRPGAPLQWPPLMDIEVAELEHELQRRWLLWYDEVVRKGVVDFGALDDVLTGRQREWENTPHPGFSGRTPAEVVRAYRPPTMRS